MGSGHFLCSVVALLAVRQSVSSPDDQCQFIFKEDSVLEVELSQKNGGKVRTDLHVADRFKCAEACCSSEGEWCTLAVFHTNTGPEQMNCFLVQCVPEGSQDNVCVTKHVRHSGFVTADVKHPSPPTSPPPPSTTPSISPPPPVASPNMPSPESLSASSSVAPKSLTSASSTLPSSLVISANDSAEALNDLNAAVNSSLTSPSSNPASASITPKPSLTPAVTDIPSHEEPTTLKATTKTLTTATSKASIKVTTQAVVAETTPNPKWTSPASVAANGTSNSNATQPTNASQTGQDQTKSPEEVKHSNINRTTVTQTGILIVTLCFGIIFLLAMMVVVGKRWCEGYQRRKYSKVDYLINGYYS